MLSTTKLRSTHCCQKPAKNATVQCNLTSLLSQGQQKELKMPCVFVLVALSDLPLPSIGSVGICQSLI